MPEMKQVREGPVFPTEKEMERQQVDKFLGDKNREEESRKRKERKTKQIERELETEFPSILRSRPEGGLKCTSPVHKRTGEEPAVALFSHGGVLGDDIPNTFPLCQDCMSLLKVTPIEGADIKEGNSKDNRLIAIANKLDKIGLYKEADIIDKILKG